MLRIANEDAFCQGLDAWLLAAEKTVGAVLKGLVVEVYRELALSTPQWSGNAASNWMLGIGTPDVSTTTTLKQRSVRGGTHRGGFGRPSSQKGGPIAVAEGASRENPKLARVSLATPEIYVTNSSVNLSGQAYIQHLEANTNDFLRAVNRPGAMVQNAPAKLAHGLLDEAGVARLVSLGEAGLLGLG